MLKWTVCRPRGCICLTSPGHSCKQLCVSTLSLATAVVLSVLAQHGDKASSQARKGQHSAVEYAAMFMTFQLPGSVNFLGQLPGGATSTFGSVFWQRVCDMSGSIRSRAWMNACLCFQVFTNWLTFTSFRDTTCKQKMQISTHKLIILHSPAAGKPTSCTKY